MSERKVLNRHSMRLKGFDYSRPGYYFITICTADRQPFFGEIDGARMVLNDLGRAVEECWLKIPEHYPDVEVDRFVVMPDHFHGIIRINESAAGVQNIEPLRRETPAVPPVHENRYQHIIPGSIGAIVRGFKIGVTKWYRQNSSGSVVWQRNFHERIIWTDVELERVRDYILCNP